MSKIDIYRWWGSGSPGSVLSAPSLVETQDARDYSAQSVANLHGQPQTSFVPRFIQYAMGRSLGMRLVPYAVHDLALFPGLGARLVHDLHRIGTIYMYHNLQQCEHTLHLIKLNALLQELDRHVVLARLDVDVGQEKPAMLNFFCILSNKEILY